MEDFNPTEEQVKRVRALFTEKPTIPVVLNEIQRVGACRYKLIEPLHEYCNEDAIVHVVNVGETVKVGGEHYIEFIVLENFINLEEYDGNRRDATAEINFWCQLIKQQLEEYKKYVY